MSAHSSPSSVDGPIRQVAQLLQAAVANTNFHGNIYFRFFKDSRGRVTLQHHSVSLPKSSEGIGVRHYGGEQ